MPGLLLATALGATTWYRAWKNDYPRMQPASWGDAPAQGTMIDADGRRATTTFTDSIDDGQATRRWCVDEGDPLGSWRVRVTWGDLELVDLEFEMVADER